jgi:hypothetical protein
MFEYVRFEHSTAFWLIVSFVLTSGVFLTAIVLTMLMKPSRREHLSSLPLDDSEGHGTDDSQTR